MTVALNAEHVGSRVAYWRRQRNLSQQGLAIAVGRSKSWVDKVERGVRRLDRLTVVTVVAAALQLDTEELVGVSVANVMVDCDACGRTLAAARDGGPPAHRQLRIGPAGLYLARDLCEGGDR